MASEVIELQLRDDSNAVILTTHVPKHNLSGTSAPGSSDDEVMGGYAKGSVWIDGTNGKAYTCVDSTSSAAVWVHQGTVPKHNFAGTSAPTATDDGADGYSKGSVWIDGTAGRAYTCVDSTTSAAVWVDQGTVFAGDITGSRDSNAALASLLTALASIGLITDSTTA